MNSIDFHLPTIFSHIPYAKGIGFVPISSVLFVMAIHKTEYILNENI